MSSHELKRFFHHLISVVNPVFSSSASASMRYCRPGPISGSMVNISRYPLAYSRADSAGAGDGSPNVSKVLQKVFIHNYSHTKSTCARKTFNSFQERSGTTPWYSDTN